MRHVIVIWSRLYALGAIISLTAVVAGCGVPEKSASLDATVMAESASGEMTDADEKPTGKTLTNRYLLVDTHIDVPYRLQNMPDQDVGGSTMRCGEKLRLTLLSLNSSVTRGLSSHGQGDSLRKVWLPPSLVLVANCTSILPVVA